MKSLGTVSCMNTQGADADLDPCVLRNWSSRTVPASSANDLFRYNAAGSLALNNAYIGLEHAPSGAYFSFNGGVTNGADGAVFNTISNKDDYADHLCSELHLGPFSGRKRLHRPELLTSPTDGGAEIKPCSDAVRCSTGTRARNHDAVRCGNAGHVRVPALSPRVIPRTPFVARIRTVTVSVNAIHTQPVHSYPEGALWRLRLHPLSNTNWPATRGRSA